MRAEFDHILFWKTVDHVRRERGLTGRALAAEAGVSRSLVSRLRNRQRPDLASVVALAVWAGISVDDYIVRAQPTTPSSGGGLVDEIAARLWGLGLSVDATRSLEWVFRTACLAHQATPDDPRCESTSG